MYLTNAFLKNPKYKDPKPVPCFICIFSTDEDPAIDNMTHCGISGEVINEDSKLISCSQFMNLHYYEPLAIAPNGDILF